MSSRRRSYGSSKRRGRTSGRRSGRKPAKRSRLHQAAAVEWNRVDILRVVFTVFGIVIIGRLFFVQVVEGKRYKTLALESHTLEQALLPERGEITVQDPYAENGTAPIATNRELYEVHAEPVHITDLAATATALSPLLNISEEDLLPRLDKPDDPDELLKRRVPQEVVDAITDLELPGIAFRQEQCSG